MAKQDTPERGITIKAEQLPRGMTTNIDRVQATIQMRTGQRRTLLSIQLEALEIGLKQMEESK